MGVAGLRELTTSEEQPVWCGSLFPGPLSTASSLLRLPAALVLARPASPAQSSTIRCTSRFVLVLGGECSECATGTGRGVYSLPRLRSSLVTSLWRRNRSGGSHSARSRRLFWHLHALVTTTAAMRQQTHRNQRKRGVISTSILRRIIDTGSHKHG